MKKIFKFLKKYGWCMWLGFSIGIVGYGIFNWQLWFILLPTVILVFISKGVNNEKDI